MSKTFSPSSKNFKPQIGDIILVHTDTPSNWLSMVRFGSWWTHAAMYYGDGRTVEMTNKNVRNLTFIKRYAHKKIRVVRLHGLTVRDRLTIRREAKRLGHLKFDRIRLVIPLVPQFRKGRFWCTSFIDLVYRKALGFHVNTARIMQNRKGYLQEIRAEVVYDYRGKK